MTTQNKKKTHLLGFIQHGVNSHATGMWRHPKDKVGWSFSTPEYWQHMARTMERGLFDAMFIADELAPYNTHENSSDAIVKWAVQCPNSRTFHDRSDHHHRNQTPRRRGDAVDGLRTSVFDVPPAFEPRPSLRGQGGVEYRVLLLEKRVGRLRPSDDGAKRALRAARGVYGGLLQALGFLGARRDHR